MHLNILVLCEDEKLGQEFISVMLEANNVVLNTNNRWKDENGNNVYLVNSLEDFLKVDVLGEKDQLFIISNSKLAKNEMEIIREELKNSAVPKKFRIQYIDLDLVADEEGIDYEDYDKAFRNCTSYEERLENKIVRYDSLTGYPIYDNVAIGVCLGTKECEEVSCNGNKYNKHCVYYNDNIKRLAKQFDNLDKKRERDNKGTFNS